MSTRFIIYSYISRPDLITNTDFDSASSPVTTSPKYYETLGFSAFSSLLLFRERAIKKSAVSLEKYALQTNDVN